MHHLSPEKKLLGLKIHAISFVVGMSVTLAINSFTGKPYWVAWVFLGWGVGLLSHWLAVRSYPTRNA
jgi:hypothetical protein